MKTELASDKLIPFLSEKFKTELKYNPKSVIERKEVFINKVTSVDKDGTCECIITTEEPDRMGDIVISSGIDTTEFKKIPSVYINHNYAALPVATCEELMHKDKSIHAKIRFVTTVPAIKNIFELVKAGALRGVSIGFEAKNALMRGTKEFDEYIKTLELGEKLAEKVRRIFTKWSLYEFSVCSVPANSGCYVKSLIDAKQEVSPDLAKILGLEPVEEVKEEVKAEVKTEVVEEVKTEVKEEVKTEVKAEVKTEVKTEVKEEVEVEVELEEVLKEDAIKEPDEFKDADEFDIVLKPFPGYHASRQRDPDDFEKGSFRYLKDKGGKGVDFIVGRLKGQDTLTLQSIRFDKDSFSAEEAKKWCKDHGYKDNVEAAKSIEPEVVKTKEPLKYWTVVRTPEDVEEYIGKVVEAKRSGKLDIEW